MPLTHPVTRPHRFVPVDAQAAPNKRQTVQPPNSEASQPERISPPNERAAESVVPGPNTSDGWPYPDSPPVHLALELFTGDVERPATERSVVEQPVSKLPSSDAIATHAVSSVGSVLGADAAVTARPTRSAVLLERDVLHSICDAFDYRGEMPSPGTVAEAINEPLEVVYPVLLDLRRRGLIIWRSSGRGVALQPVRESIWF